MSRWKKTVLWSLAMLLLLAGGFLGMAYWLGDEGPINPAGFARLQIGMTRAEMGQILGQELPTDGMLQRYFAGTFQVPEKQWGTIGWIPGPEGWACWETKRYIIEVYFDGQDRALNAFLYRVPGTELSFWQRVRRWLRM